MDILTYDYLLKGLKDCNANSSKNYGNTVVKFPTINTTYPLTVFSEIRNVANPSFLTCHEKVSSVGYSVRIYAKTKGNKDKQTIAREIALMCDSFLSGIGLTRTAFNANESINDNSIYEIIMTYSGNLYENKRRFI
jgi:hypothetical protein